MSYQGPTSTKFGRKQSPPPMQLHRFHVADDPATLAEVSHTLALPTLDQEDFGQQGIDVTQLVPSAQPTDALGSCTCEAGTGHAAERWVAAGKDLDDLELFGLRLSGTDAVEDQKAAILLYHAVTDQTGDPSTEWPPTDCGSSGYYVANELERIGVAATYKSAPDITAALSLLQTGTVMQGFPWMNAWMTPDSQGFVDGDGSADALMAAISSGVAGGHETLQVGIPQLAVTGGQVDLQNTVIECLNSWSPSWGPLGGRYRIHASTLAYLGSYADYKAIVV